MRTALRYLPNASRLPQLRRALSRHRLFGLPRPESDERLDCSPRRAYQLAAPGAGRRGRGADLPTRLCPTSRAASAQSGFPETPNTHRREFSNIAGQDTRFSNIASQDTSAEFASQKLCGSPDRKNRRVRKSRTLRYPLAPPQRRGTSTRHLSLPLAMYHGAAAVESVSGCAGSSGNSTISHRPCSG